MKIDFSRIPCYVDIRKEGKQEMDVKYDLSNQMYINGHGVAVGALALKIYNSQGEEDYSEQECQILLAFLREGGYPPIFIDSVEELVAGKEEQL